MDTSMETEEIQDHINQLKRKRSDDADLIPRTSSDPEDGEQKTRDASADGAEDSTTLKRAKTDNWNGHSTRSPVKVPEDRSKLPGEIWQYIFTFLAPPTLGQLLSTNRAFKDLLCKAGSRQDDVPSIGGHFDLHDCNFIWSTSRRLFFPTMPRPLSSRTEMEMWRLIRGHSCQFCGKKGSQDIQTARPEPWTGGPGPDGVRIIWPFGVRSCSECLSSRMKKEMDIMFSSSIPSALLPALPFAFFTPSLDYVSPITLRANSPPPNIPLSKYYSQPHLDEIKRRFEEVRVLGGSTAEEWFKGLEGTGKESLADALRWEQWDAQGGLQRIHAFRVNRPQHLFLPPKPVVAAPPQLMTSSLASDASNIGTPSGIVRPESSHQPLAMNTTQSPNPQSQKNAFSYNVPPPGFPPFSSVTLPPKPMTPMNQFGSLYPQQAPPQQMPPQVAPRPAPIPMPIQPHVPQPRAERSIRDVNEAKAQRRADIERRCMELDPPITASVLIHMESFAAAIQIPMALTEPGWEVLKPRLLAQREVAESRESEQLQQSQLMQARTEERRQQEAQLREAKENMDRQWDEMQKPLRDKLNHYADEILHAQWRGGDAVNKDNCAQFAADLLIYVRKRFYQIQEYEDNLMLVSGRPIRQDIVGSAPNRKLTLENMKWVYDTKIKPFAEVHSKEIFLCSACDSSSKSYGFEGVIQHYAAKHTSVLSMGSVVVHWKADWPEDPPFNPNPTKSPPIVPSNQANPQSAYGATPSYSQDHQNQAVRPETTSYAMQIYPQYSPGASERGSYIPQSAGAYQQPQYASSSPPNNAYAQIGMNGPQHSQQLAYVNGTAQHGTQIPGQTWSVPSHSPAEVRPQSSLNMPQTYVQQPNWTPTQQRPQGASRPTYPPQFGAPGQPFGIYQVQLEELAKNAREIFDGTSAVKDFPTSVRTHVIIHHVVLRFKDRFTNDPNLALFTDGLNNSSQMKPLRNIGDLSCKTCAVANPELSAEVLRVIPIEDGHKLYTLPALLTHFQSVHIEQAKPAMVSQTGIEPPRLDWKFDMIQLPNNLEVLKLIDAPGMNDTKLGIVAAVFPSIFPSPLPKIGYREPYVEQQDTYSGQPNGIAKPVEQYRGADSESDAQPVIGHARHSIGGTTTNGIEVAVDDFPKFVESPMRDSAKSVEPAREDEYDPHRPLYVAPGPGSFSRFDHFKANPTDSTHIPITVQAHNGFVTSNHSNLPPHGNNHRYSNEPSHQQSAFTPSAAAHKPQTISAAEHFLNSFEPNDDQDSYEPPDYTPSDAGNIQPRPAFNSDAHALGHHSPPSTTRLTAQGQAWATQASYVQGGNWKQPAYSANRDMRVSDRRSEPQRPLSALGTDQGRYHPNGSGSTQYVDQQYGQLAGRFERYDPPHQVSSRPRSRSPPVMGAPTSAAAYYRPHSPVRLQGQPYASQPVMSERDRYPAAGAVQHMQEHHRQQYVDRGYGGYPYEGQVEYIRVPAPDSHEPPPTPYYVERQPQAAPHYVQYEEPVFEHNGQLYKRSTLPPEREGTIQRQYYR